MTAAGSADEIGIDQGERRQLEGAIAELKYAETHRYRPFALVSPAFVPVDSAEPDATRRPDGLVISNKRPAAPFLAVEVRLETPAPTVVMAGIASAEGDHALAAYDVTRQRVAIELRIDGRTRVVAVRNISLAPPVKLAFALCENQITALADRGEGWEPLVTTRKNVAAFVDFRSTEMLSRFSYAYGARPADTPVATPATSPHAVRRMLRQLKRSGRSDGQGVRAAGVPAADGRPPGGGAPSWGAGHEQPQVTSVRAGLFGMTGVRDPHLVQSPDGTPYIRDRKLYLTMTCAGLGFFQQAHWGVFTLDLDDLTRLEQVAQLYFTRDGLVLGDHAGQIIVDGDRCIVAASSWGDFEIGSIHVRHIVTGPEVLSGVHVLATQRFELPTRFGAWDPAFARVDDRWYVGFVESPSQEKRFQFHPALAVTAPGGDYTGPHELVGADDSLQQCEGPILTQVDGHWILAASDSDVREYLVYDLDMRRLGTLDAPYLTNIPHPQLVTIDGADGPRQLMVTFDGTPYGVAVVGYGGHGDLVIMETLPSR